MMTVAEIKRSIMGLPEAEFSQLMKWVWDHDWKRWDHQLEEDIKAGRLEFLKEKVLEAGKQRDLGNPHTEIVFQVRESPDGGYSASADFGDRRFGFNRSSLQPLSLESKRCDQCTKLE